MKQMVIDGNSILNRAFYGIRMLNAPDGTPTNAVYGFLAILNKLLTDEKPDGLAVCFDLKAPTFRHTQYADYKAQRKPMPEELAVQLPILREALDAMNVRRFALEGWEADDLLGALARQCEERGEFCVIVTGDKDSFQLITDAVTVKHVKTRMGQTETVDYTPAVFFAEYGFAPPRMVDLKALMGDSSDNIPGIAGVGEKTALELIRRFGSLEGVYANLGSPDIRDGVRKKLEAGKDSAFLSHDLATIRTNAPIAFDPAETALRAPDSDRLYALFQKLGFKKFIETFHLTAPVGGAAPGVSREAPHVVVNDIGEAIQAVNRAELIAVLTVDGGLDALELCDGERGYAIRWGEGTGDYNELLRAVFRPEVKKISHNVKDLMRLLQAENLPTSGFVFDTALAAYLLEATDSTYDLPRLTQKYLGREEGGAFAVFDLCTEFRRKLEENGQTDLFRDIELPLCQVLADMEREGFLVDRAALHDFGESLQTAITALERDIYRLAGEEFNILSPKQLGAVLFEHLMLPAGKKTKTGWSTNVDVLEKLIGKHPVIRPILDYRQLTKLKSTYAEGLQKVIGPDGRIHTSFQMTVTATGRLSSTEPNLQNIPVRTELGAQIRKMFVAAPGNVLVDADYSQIELRLLAHISGDAHMKEAFLSGEDIHTVTASQVFGVPFAEVSSLMRRRAKAVNFGIVYGISAFSLSQDIGVSQPEAKAYIDAYLEKYDGVRAYRERVIAQAKEDGYVTTLYGRRRSLPELKSSNFNLRSFGERVALNMPIQGTAADIMKIAMLRVAQRLQAEGLEARLILQVHDELIAECPEAEARRVAALLDEEMEAAAQLSVPLTAEAKYGKSWASAK
ncbi:MAG: DNA polymerase I [Firmicutes bacterium]|nr:DNA polymerase I [Bacillota bacterium]